MMQQESASVSFLQYEDHLLLQVLQGGEQRRLDEAVVMLVVDLSGSHRQNVVVVHGVELDGRLGVALFGLVPLFICAGAGAGVG